jgi:hypothetical protein
VHGVAAHDAAPVSENVTCWPVTGADGENENSAFGGVGDASFVVAVVPLDDTVVVPRHTQSPNSPTGELDSQL